MFVFVTALYNNDKSYLPDGRQFTIEVSSTIVVGTKMLPTEIVIPGATGAVVSSDLLVLKTKNLGDLYLNLTMAEYQALVAQATTDTNATREFENLGAPVTTFQDDALANSVLLQVAGDSVIFALDDVTYSSDGTVTIPIASNLIQILYRKI